jgi:hypothetical protein
MKTFYYSYFALISSHFGHYILMKTNGKHVKDQCRLMYSRQNGECAPVLWYNWTSCRGAVALEWKPNREQVGSALKVRDAGHVKQSPASNFSQDSHSTARKSHLVPMDSVKYS